MLELKIKLDIIKPDREVPYKGELLELMCFTSKWRIYKMKLQEN